MGDVSDCAGGVHPLGASWGQRAGCEDAEGAAAPTCTHRERTVSTAQSPRVRRAGCSRAASRSPGKGLQGSSVRRLE